MIFDSQRVYFLEKQGEAICCKPSEEADLNREGRNYEYYWN